MNNLKQLGIALQNYHLNFKRFPHNSHFSKGTFKEGGRETEITEKDFKGSMILKLMPFLEEQALSTRWISTERSSSNSMPRIRKSGRSSFRCCVAPAIPIRRSARIRRIFRLMR